MHIKYPRCIAYIRKYTLTFLQRERLLREDNAELEKVIKIGQAAEQTKTYAKQIKGDKTADYLESSGRQTDKLALIKNCKFCGRTHNRGNCPAYGKECNHCKKKNHFANVSRKVVNEIHIREFT